MVKNKEKKKNKEKSGERLECHVTKFKTEVQ